MKDNQTPFNQPFSFPLVQAATLGQAFISDLISSQSQFLEASFNNAVEQVQKISTLEDSKDFWQLQQNYLQKQNQQFSDFAGKVVENINKVQSEYPTIFNFTQSGGQEKTSVAVPAELVVKKPKKAAEKKPRAAAKKAPAKGKAAAGKAAAKPAAKTAKAKTAAKPAAKAAAKPAAKAALKAKPAAAAKTEAQSQLVIPQVEKTNGASSNSPMSPATPPAKS